MPDQDCPLCGAVASYIETLTHGWRFCNCCGRAFLIDPASGRLLHQTETQHERANGTAGKR